MNKKVLSAILLICVLFSMPVSGQGVNKEEVGKNVGSKSHNGSTVKTKPADISDCPVKVPVKPDGYDVVTPTQVAKVLSKANIVRSTQTMHFDMVELNDIQLQIPAFKQFKNNKTDFTADGEQQFKELANKVRLFLGTDNKSKPITLRITGSASQIPTSFDPSKPNNNLNSDGSSISGKTSVENNKLLAKARADELAKKLKRIFPGLTVITPLPDEITLGTTPWTSDCQKRLNEAVKKRNKEAIDKIFEPFQADQWVKVESSDRTSKKVQPESVKMYMVSTTPSLKTKIDGKEEMVKTIFVVSKNTYDKVGPTRTFATVGERDRFLRRLSLKIFHWDKDTIQRWYLLAGGNEIKAFNTADEKTRIIELYKNGINDINEETLLESYIRSEIEKQYKQ